MFRIIGQSSGRLVLGLLLCSLCGCGQGDGLVRVNGKVTVDGNPVPLAVITFRPAGGVGTTYVGETDMTGDYKVYASESSQGILPGYYFAEVLSAKLTANELTEEQMKVYNYVPIPKKHAGKEANPVTIPPEGGTINFEFTSK